ncbi:MAG: glucose-1-phosphate thymidylyltransferase [Oligoflexus sp.]
MTEPLKLESFVDLSRITNRELFEVESVFQLFGQSLKDRLSKYLTDLGVDKQPIIHGNVHPHAVLEGAVYVAQGATVGPAAYIQGPCYIGPGAEVRHAAFIRGSVYVGAKAVVGHTTEVKGSIFFDEAKAGHFAYVGDSLLGFQVNLGAGTKLANLKLNAGEVKVRLPGIQTLVSSGLKKFGSIMGDQSQTGCNAVLSPGTLLLAKTAVLPCVHFHGTLEKGFARGSSAK